MGKMNAIGQSHADTYRAHSDPLRDLLSAELNIIFVPDGNFVNLSICVKSSSYEVERTQKPNSSRRSTKSNERFNEKSNW